MSDNSKRAGKQALGLFLILVIIGLTLLLSLQHDPQTGSISINIMVLIWGIILAAIIYIALTFKGYRESGLFRLRFCVACGRSIPFDSVICPYCRYDFEKKEIL